MTVKQTMRYIYFQLEKEEFYIELDNENYALRQIIIPYDNKTLISCRNDCLAEGQIDLDNLEGKISYIAKETFEKAWSVHTSPYRKIWNKEKKVYPIGNYIEGIIKYFYPHGIIFDIGNLQGCADYRVTQNNSPADSLNINHIISGVVSGYDEDNMWLLIDESKAE